MLGVAVRARRAALSRFRGPWLPLVPSGAYGGAGAFRVAAGVVSPLVALAGRLDRCRRPGASRAGGVLAGAVSAHPGRHRLAQGGFPASQGVGAAGGQASPAPCVSTPEPPGRAQGRTGRVPPVSLVPGGLPVPPSAYDVTGAAQGPRPAGSACPCSAPQAMCAMISTFLGDRRRG